MQKTTNAMKYLPAIFGIASLALFAAFVVSLYSELVLKTWSGTIQYYTLVSSVGVYLELSLLSFALALALTRMTRVKMVFTVAGIGLVAVSIFNTVFYTSLALTSFSEWYSALIVRIVLPLGLGVAMMAIIPLAEILLGGLLNKTASHSDIQDMFRTIENTLGDLKMQTKQDLQPEISAISDQIGKMRSKVGLSSPASGVTVFIPEPTPLFGIRDNTQSAATGQTAELSTSSDISNGPTSALAPAGNTGTAEMQDARPKRSDDKAKTDLKRPEPKKPAIASAAKGKPKVIANKKAIGTKKETKKPISKVKKETEAAKTKAAKTKPPKAIARKKAI